MSEDWKTINFITKNKYRLNMSKSNKAINNELNIPRIAKSV